MRHTASPSPLAPLLFLALLAPLLLAPGAGCDDGGSGADPSDTAPGDTAEGDDTSAPDTGTPDALIVNPPDTSDAVDAADAVDMAEPDLGPSELEQYGPLFDPEHVLQVELTLEPEHWTALRGETRALLDVIGPGCLDAPHESPFTWYAAQARIDGQDAGRIGVRKKGFLGSLDAAKPSLKLELDRFVEGQHFHTLERMTLNNGRQDPSLVQTCLGYAVWRRAGHPAPRCNLAHVVVNGEDLGVYAHVQDVRKQMLREHFADDEGALYEGTLSDFRDGWMATFDRKTNEELTDRSDLQALADALTVPDDALIGALEQVLDLDAFMTHWALEVLVAHWDGYASNTNNFFVYANPDDGGRFVFVPWGIDSLFTPWTDSPGLSSNGFESLVANGALARRLAMHPEGRARYEARLRELLETVWDEAWLHAELDRLERQVLEHSAAELHPVLSGRIAGIRGFVDARRAAVSSELDAGLPAWSSELREPICATPRGTVDWSFETTFGTFDDPDIFATGTGTSHALSFDEVDYAVWQFGAKAGMAPEPEKLGLASILLAAVVSPDLVIVVNVDLPPDALVPGATLDFENLGQAVLATFQPSTGAITLIGFLLDGTLTLEQAGATEGAPVTGRVTGDVYRLGF